MTDLAGALAELEAESGVGYAQVQRLLCRLVAIGGDSVGALVEATGVPHRRVLEVLRRLGFDASDQRSGVGEAAREELRRLLACDEVPAPDDLVETVARVVAERPPSVWSLDHVPATEATIVERARHLAGRYALAGRHLVCLGDHDLTAVAVKLLVPGATVSVVDVDERLLAYLDAVSDHLGLGLRLYAADLRLGLPRTLREDADLVFTDPPYSLDGIDLFVRRGVEALSDRPGASVLFCYGTAERGAEHLLDVQRLLVRLHLVLEALLPGFNRYHGAHAIGAASALWVVRPSKRTRPTVAAAGAKPADARIYSRGGASRESPAPALPAEILAAVGPAHWVDAAEVIEAAIQLPRLGARRQWPDAIAVDLGRFYGSSALRVVMAAPPGARLLVVGDARAVAVARQDPATRLVAARFATETLVEPLPLGLLSATPVPAG
ncbi:MAG TPA: bis-aminopropyl spermidine synthase family protein, partial [Actinomycetota bacterium]|nr:bis-aminopropyl spermidine synthase family protein [Actinomycetota bacterium]